MKMWIVLLVSLILTSFVSAADIETNYYIYENKVLVEHYFDSISNLELRIPYDVDKPEVNSNYELEDFGSYKIIKIISGKNISIKYITSSMIDKSKNTNYFTSLNYLEDSQKVKLVFPEFAILVEGGIVFPEPDSISSDGRSIILNWDDYSEEQIIINYEVMKNNSFIWYLILLIVILFFILHSNFQKKKFKKKIEKISEKNKGRKKELLTKNLFEDEKKIVEFLLNKKGREAWTKEIFREVGISKVKLSRKLKSLEKKELIKKIPYGNENKIRLLRK